MIRFREKNNKDLRELIEKSKVPQYEIARRCGISEGSICRWLRYELSIDDPRRQLIIDAIEDKCTDHE